jgi:hypothetical protein
MAESAPSTSATSGTPTSKGAAGVKACTICGLDITNAPRTKDAKGGYVCTDCMKKAQSTAQALKSPPKVAAVKPAESDDEDNAFLLNLGTASQALQGGKECPKCERVLNQTDHLCLGCGYNFDAGKVVQTKVVRAPKVKGESSGSGGLSHVHVAIGMIAACVLPQGIHMAAPGEIYLLVGTLACVLVGLGSVIFGAFMVMKSESVLKAVAFIFIPFYGPYWALTRSAAYPAVASSYGAAVIATIMMQVYISQFPAT